MASGKRWRHPQAHPHRPASGALAAGRRTGFCRGGETVNPPNEKAAGAGERTGGPSDSTDSNLAWVAFPTDVLPDPVGRFVTDSAAAMQCDASYLALPTLAALAATIGASRNVELHGGWREPCILWG